MQVERLAIQDVVLLRPAKFDDPRGFFSETYNAKAFASAVAEIDFVQDNHSLSVPAGTVRGLHFQIPPFAQAKLVRVLRGAIRDIAVDIRHGSPTFGRHVAAELTARNWAQLYVPEGFAHGFVTLEAETEVFYKVSGFYSRDCDRGLLWKDPDLAIDWGVSAADAVLSAKDPVHPRLVELPRYFEYKPGA